MEGRYPWARRHHVVGLERERVHKDSGKIGRRSYKDGTKMSRDNRKSESSSRATSLPRTQTKADLVERNPAVALDTAVMEIRAQTRSVLDPQSRGGEGRGPWFACAERNFLAGSESPGVADATQGTAPTEHAEACPFRRDAAPPPHRAAPRAPRPRVRPL